MDDVTFEEQYGFTKEAAIAHVGLEEGETLAHFGVKGMKWGKRKARGSRPASSGRPRMGNRSVNPGATKSGDGKSEKAPMSRKKKIAIGVGIGVGAAALTVGGIYAARALNKSGGINLSDIKSRSTFAVNASKSFMNDSATKAKNQATSVSMLAEAAARSGSNKARTAAGNAAAGARRTATRAGDIARNPRTSAGLAGLAVRDAAAPAVNRAGQLGRYGKAVGGRAVRNATADARVDIAAARQDAGNLARGAARLGRNAAGSAAGAARNAASLAGDASDAARGAADLARRGAGTAVRNGAGNVARGARNAAGAAAKEARTAGDIARLAAQNPGVVGNAARGAASAAGSAARGAAGTAARGVAGGARVSASNVRKATSSLAKEGRAAASLGAMITRNPGIAAQLAAAPTMAKAKNIISGLDIGAVSPKALATLLRDLR